MEPLNDLTPERLQKLEKISESCPPYPSSFNRTHTLQELQTTYASLDSGAETQDTSSVAGRIMSVRNSGLFIDLQDASGRLQLFCHAQHLCENSQALLKNLDLGDWIGATGFLRKTKRGEVTLNACTLTFLCKTLCPLPDKHHGLSDPETRYRMRYVDFIVTPQAKLIMEKRSAVLSHIRRHLEEKGFMEVETPMLHTTPGGALAKPFVTHHNALHTDLYLRIAPELYLKRLVVGGFEKVFEMNRCFRNEGLSPRHNPEFTSIEIYEAFVDYTAMMDLTETLVSETARAVMGTSELTYGNVTLQFKAPWPRRSMADLVQEKTGVNFLDIASDADAHAQAKKLGFPQPAYAGWGKILAALFEECVEKDLIQPTHVTGFPTEVSPLAKMDPKDPRLTERFETYVNGWEIANGFSELNDPLDQKKRFEEQLSAAAAGEEETHAMDEDYLNALAYGLPPTGGLGIGIDRLVMLLTNAPSIREVLAFPTLRPKKTSA